LSEFPTSAHNTMVTSHTELNWPHIVLVVAAVAVVVALSVYAWRRWHQKVEV
jgi:Mg2+ and Co2+ transporter CorA